MSEPSTGFPGYNILKTSWFGKDHNMPAFAASQLER